MSNEKTVMVQVLGEGAASLDGIAGPVVGRRFALTAGTFVIGREADADLSLPDDNGLSRVHAKIVADGERYKIIDNESRNGTLVNDKPVRSVHLFDGDIVRVGSSTMRFSQATARRNMEPTALIHPDQLAPPGPRPPPGPTGPIAPPRGPALAPWIAAVAGAAVTVLVLLAVVIGIFIGRGSGGPESVPPIAATEPAGNDPATPVKEPAAPVADAIVVTEPVGAAPVAASGSGAETPFSPARFVAGVDDVVRIKGGGKVESVDVKDGDTVEKGAQLAIVVGVGASAADIATRKESIAALESVAESNERAAKALAEERAGLEKLLAQTAKLKVAAPAAGKVQQLVLSPGDVVRSGQVVARIVGAPARVEIDVDAALAARLEPGAACELVLKEEGATAPAAQGTLREKRDNGAQVTLSIEPAADAARAKDVVKARCPP